MTSPPSPRVLLYLGLPAMREQLRAQITGRFPHVQLIATGDAAQAQAEVGRTDVLMSFGPMLTGTPLLAQARSLRWLHSLGTGVDGLIDNPDLAPGVLLTATRGIHGPAMSETAFTTMLALSRELPRSLRNQAARRWERWPVRVLYKQQVGILGVGAIAEDLALRCAAFGMIVTGISRTPREAPGFHRMVTRAQLPDVVGEFDFLVLTVPYEADSHHIVDAALLARMKPGAILVNIARGGVVDEAALAEALRSGRVAGAGLDVFAEEPPPADSPFWGMDNVIMTAHQGGFSTNYADEAFPQLAHNLQAFLDERPQDMSHRIPRQETAWSAAPGRPEQARTAGNAGGIQ